MKPSSEIEKIEELIIDEEFHLAAAMISHVEEGQRYLFFPIIMRHVAHFQVQPHEVTFFGNPLLGSESFASYERVERIVSNSINGYEDVCFGRANRAWGVTIFNSNIQSTGFMVFTPHWNLGLLSSDPTPLRSFTIDL
jgi:hypothetical protein